jgi:hypothetical protein
MKVVFRGLCNDALIIQSSAAELFVSRQGVRWLAKWSIIQGPKAQVVGQVLLDSKDLSSAFGLSEETGPLSRWMLSECGANSASQGKFIRSGDFLNIPGPGTGHDGDPNISILIQGKMQDAVRRLIYHCR